MPQYTQIAEKAGIAGRVELALLVEPSGEVDCVAVMEGLPMGLTEAAIDAAFDWKFEPDSSWDGPRQIRVDLDATLGVQYPSRE